MATTIPREWEGTPTLTPAKVELIEQWYRDKLDDCDKASDIDDAAYWSGMVDALTDVLSLLFEAPDV